MSIITITSDWGKSDYYLPSFKGKIFSLLPSVQIVDLNHNIPAHNISKAAFSIRNSYSHFPAGTIHIIAVRSEKTKKNRYLAVQYEGHYFLGTDNGIFGLLMQKEPEKIIELNSEFVTSTFPELYVYAEAACHLANGLGMSLLGKEINDLKRSTPLRATYDDNFINGSVIYTDSYRNAITNISKDLFLRIGRERKFGIYVQSFNKKNMISRISNNYSEVPVGELVAIFNSINLLEIALNEGEVVDLFNLEMNNSIIIKFYD